MKASTAFFAGLIASTGSSYAFLWGAVILLGLLVLRKLAVGYVASGPE